MNRRAVTRFGCCIQRGKGYTIELSERLLTAPEGACTSRMVFPNWLRTFRTAVRL